jgi:4-alpha-glucanotransferase
VVAYTGTHDNDTLVGWLNEHEREKNPERRARLQREREQALAYAGSDGDGAHWDLIRVLFASAADTVIVPLQDLLGLGTEARMNVPGTPSGNWTFRAPKESYDARLASRLRAISDTYERIPGGLQRG